MEVVDHLSPVQPLPAVHGILRLRVLRMPAQRPAIAALRALSASAVEDDLNLQLADRESLRDEIGVVAAIYRAGEPIATIRFVPSGHGVTGAERLSAHLGEHPDFLGPGNWEVGRLIVAPDERSPQILGRCLALALAEIVHTRTVQNFYAIATPTMARLWRRFGMTVVAHVSGRSGTPYVVVRGRVQDVARALKMTQLLPQAARVAEPETSPWCDTEAMPL